LHVPGDAENAALENSAPKCRVEYAALKNVAPICRGRKCRTEKCDTKSAWVEYARPTSMESQPTHDVYLLL